VNIFSNAVKYGKIDGEISAGVYHLEDEKILIEITDNGIGIDEAHIPRLFERFYRTDDARSREIGGSGLGLAICKHIVEAHGENIHVRSQLNVGTTIGFTLPQ
jgi:two-component system phosphate regulon sensor histidine kinase PhoR